MTWGGRKVARAHRDVLDAYGSTCWLCGGPIDLDAEWWRDAAMSVDHVLPRSLGGPDDLANLRPAHRTCNVRRSNGLAASTRRIESAILP